jgi:hypothetical protein
VVAVGGSGYWSYINTPAIWDEAARGAGAAAAPDVLAIGLGAGLGGAALLAAAVGAALLVRRRRRRRAEAEAEAATGNGVAAKPGLELFGSRGTAYQAGGPAGGAGEWAGSGVGDSRTAIASIGTEGGRAPRAAAGGAHQAAGG